MSSAYATKLAEGFSQRLLKEMYDKSLLEAVVNRDYQGEINEVGSKLNILNFARVSEKTYTGADLVVDSIYENNAQLIIDQYKSFYFKIRTLDQWLSYIKDPKPTIVTQTADERNRNMETFALGAYADVAAGNRVGTNETAGTVTIDVNGNVTGGGTAFTAAMVGRGFKAVGHTKWYRILSRAGAGAIVIENDEDDVASTYDGGVIGPGAVTYVIEAATVLQITTANLLQQVAAMKLRLDTADRDEKSSVPDSDRWMIVPPEFESLLVRASGIALHVPDVYQELVKRGFITELQGFKVFKSNRLTGNNTDGFRVLAGHPNWMTFAEKPSRLAQRKI